MIGARRALVLVPTGVLLALGACDLALGLGDLKDRGPDASVGLDANVDAADDAAAEAGRRDAGPPPPATSCRDATGVGLTDCGPKGDENCCATSEIPGGSFHRGNEATSPATVSGFYLDRFEVTVGRFRAFVEATTNGGFRPAAGSGKHTHLNGGQGMALTNGGFELGWMDTWNSQLPTTAAKWRQELTLDKRCTWDSADAGEGPAAGDARPVNCVSWYEAYAFCIWDGGFLPSEAEWNYAAAGGDEQRFYPWSTPPASETIDCSLANLGYAFYPIKACTDAGTIKVGSLSPKGDGKWGQSDLGGNVWEWTLDGENTPYVSPCVDCLNVATPANRMIRGGSFMSAEKSLASSAREVKGAHINADSVGLRCARPF